MQQIRWSARRILLGLVAILATACGGPGLGNEANSGTTTENTDGSAAVIRAVATTSIIADLVKNVGGDRVSVKAILPAGSDPHTYAPAPGDVQAVAEAQILFENGAGLEEWLGELTENAGGSRPTIVVAEGITPIEGGDEAHHDEAHGSAAADEHEEHAEGADPHMWFDVQNTMRYVENIRDGLKQIDPMGAQTYDANATAYLAQLRQLDQELQQAVESIPPDRRKLVTNHATFGYFAKRYGFTVAGSVFEGISTDEEPSAQQIAKLVRTIRAENVPAIFTENTVNPRLAEQVGAEAGIKVVTNLYTDALGDPGSDGDTYLKMMRFNVRQIVEALK